MAICPDRSSALCVAKTLNTTGLRLYLEEANTAKFKEYMQWFKNSRSKKARSLIDHIIIAKHGR